MLYTAARAVRSLSEWVPTRRIGLSSRVILARDGAGQLCMHSLTAKASGRQCFLASSDEASGTGDLCIQ